jgi:phage terminase small subunit
MNAKEARFVAEFLIDGNATRAAIRAGYSERSARQLGYRLLTKDHIRKAIDEGRARVTKKAEVTAEGVVRDVKRVFEMAVLAGQYSAALKAQDLLGRHIGMWASERPEPRQTNTDGPSDIVIARQLMYFIHKVMQRQGNRAHTNRAEPVPSLLGVEQQSGH